MPLPSQMRLCSGPYGRCAHIPGVMSRPEGFHRSPRREAGSEQRNAEAAECVCCEVADAIRITGDLGADRLVLNRRRGYLDYAMRSDEA